MKDLPFRQQDAATSVPIESDLPRIQESLPDRSRPPTSMMSDTQNQVDAFYDPFPTMSNTLVGIARTHYNSLPGILSRDPRAGTAARRLTTKLKAPSLPDLPANAPLLKAVVRLEEDDTLGAARKLHQEHPNDKIAILNMANAQNRGGSWMQGSMAQEEDLCNCSTLFMHLRPPLYPIATDELIYSPDVLVVRMKDTTSAQISYNDLPVQDRFYVDTISSAAIRHPDRTNTIVMDRDGEPEVLDRYTHGADRQTMFNKLNWIINAAIAHGVQRLVLGAFGCGSFQNPVRQVASMMREILIENGTGQGTPQSWGSYGLVEIVIAVYDRAAGQPVWNGFMSEFQEAHQLHTAGQVPIPERIQYTTFPPGYQARKVNVDLPHTPAPPRPQPASQAQDQDITPPPGPADELPPPPPPPPSTTAPAQPVTTAAGGQ